MKPLSKLARAEDVLTEEAMQQLIVPVKELPEASKDQLGKSYFLSAPSTGYNTACTYKCVKTGDGVNAVYSWVQVNVTETGKLDAVTGLWATSIVNGAQAVVKLHWTDPEDKDDAHWKYDVIVRKQGGVPTSIHDGEIVGYSSVRNQYRSAAAFIDAIDSDTVDSSDILDDIVKPSTEDVYYYNVFAVTRYGIATGTTDGCPPMLSWAQFSKMVKSGRATDIVSVGDVLQVNCGTEFGVLDFHVVDISTRRYLSSEEDEDMPTVTLMTDKVLFRGSFDHYDNRVDNNPQAAIHGSNRWITSNIQEWLNGSGSNWHRRGDAYSAAFDSDGTYGYSGHQFGGFLGSLPEDLRDVLLEVPVKTTKPQWEPTRSSDPLDVRNMKVFLASYEELFGTGGAAGSSRPSDVVFSNDDGHDQYSCEGTQFGIFAQNKIDSRMKLIINDARHNTTPSASEADNLASWFTRTPSYGPVVGVGEGIDGVYMVTVRGRDPFEARRELGADGAALTKAYVSQVERDNRTKDASTSTNNNIAPGFVPCIVIGGRLNDAN